ncbi:MAG: adenylyl-sulfate kinase, partial [Proteobacteria bacterium]|nr:adenylyl-sulfate kinase [Pseudomonadota bacterium]
MSWDLDSKRIFLIGGPGGVGKTTIAAALAINLSQRGYRTLVLTVDPARRLAQALGF